VSEHATPVDDVNENHDDGNHKKNVDKTTHGVGRNEPEEPQYDQNDRNRIEHGIHLSLFGFPVL
jgi:hypothetical protein